MAFLEILFIAIGLAMDAFAVSLAAAASGLAKGRRAAFRLSFHFGLFQFMMPVIGWYLGSRIARHVSAYDHWVAFGLLACVGVRMIRTGLKEEESQDYRTDPSRGMTLVTLSVATSIDAMAIGLSLAMVRVSIWYPCIVIGVVTATLSLVAIRLGTRLGAAFGRRMEIVGGVILLLIGIRIVASHLVG